MIIGPGTFTATSHSFAKSTDQSSKTLSPQAANQPGNSQTNAPAATVQAPEAASKTDFSKADTLAYDHDAAEKALSSMMSAGHGSGQILALFASSEVAAVSDSAAVSDAYEEF